MRVCKVEVVELPAMTAMVFGANVVHSGFVVINARERNLALHWYLRNG